MFSNVYTVDEYQKELRRQAEQERLVRAVQTGSVKRSVGRSLMNLGVMLGANTSDECYTTTIRDQVVTVCPA